MACKIHQLSTEWKEDKKANYIKYAGMTLSKLVAVFVVCEGGGVVCVCRSEGVGG